MTSDKEERLHRELSQIVMALISVHGPGAVAQALENQRAWIDHEYDLKPWIDPEHLF
mgnify:CR=1 FL=1